jgi:hypothetical protein
MKKATVVTAPFNPGDRVKYRDERPADLRKLGMIGKIVDRIPPMANQVWVEFSDGTLYAVDRGALVPAD